ncbi:MAG: hypothetical protein QM500_16835 [Methylococcales bacterium]
MSEKIIDAGEFIPYAKKHLHGRSGGKTRKAETKKATCTLKKLWPEPDWYQLVKRGCPIQSVINMLVIYKNIRPRARTNSFNIPDDNWINGYKITLSDLEEIFYKKEIIHDVDAMSSLFASKYIVKDNDGVILLDQSYIAYSAGVGNGNRKIRSPFSFTLINRARIKWLCKMGWPKNPMTLETKEFPLHMEDNTWRVAKVTQAQYQWSNAQIFNSEDEALAEAIKRIPKPNENKKKTPKIKEDLYTPQKPSINQRPKKEYVKITPVELIKKFGFRGLQFGESMSNVEKQRWLNSVYWALIDLAEILDIPHRWIGLGGLGLAFGARGKGSASAHFERELNVINLTRKNGPGSIAHEWFHAADNRLAKSLGIKSELASNFMVKSYSNRPESYKFKALCDVWSVISQSGKSNYIKQATLLSGESKLRSYWKEPAELFARAFETAIQDSLLEKGIESAWLVNGTLESDYPVNKLDMCPYPTGADRLRIKTAFMTFMKILFSK